MAQKGWSFISGLGATAYFEAALAGTMDGAAPFSFGAVFAYGFSDPTSRTIFGNATFGTNGFGVRVNSDGDIEAANGTVEQASGTALADADNTYAQTPEGDLINNYKSLITTVTAGNQLAWPRPRRFNLVVLQCDVTESMTTYVNGRPVASSVPGLAQSTDPVRIGLNAAGADGMGDLLLAGCFYHNAANTQVDPAIFFLTCMQNKDCGGGFMNAQLDYVWSVKQAGWNSNTPFGIPQLVRDWPSVGAQQSIPMELNASGGTANLLGSFYEMPPQWI